MLLRISHIIILVLELTANSASRGAHSTFFASCPNVCFMCLAGCHTIILSLSPEARSEPSVVQSSAKTAVVVCPFKVSTDQPS